MRIFLTVAEEQGWTRKLERARAAYRRGSRLSNPAVLAALAAQQRFSVTELEKFAECSSAWFVERFLQPGEIDYEFGAKETGSVAHTTLHRFHERMPGELGVERLTEAELPRAVPLMRRCLEEALTNVRIPSGAAGKEAVRRLERDLEGFMRSEAEFVSPLVPRDYEVRFGTKSSPFYTANAVECAGLKLNPNWIYETIAFFIAIPTGGVCPAGTIPVYRMYNHGQTGAPNHRFTTSLATYQQFTTTMGWDPEGIGFCSPP